MPNEDWIALALATAVFWGLATLASKPATVRLGVRPMLAIVATGEGLLYLALYLLLRETVASADPVLIAAAILAGVTGILGYIFYYEGMRTGTVGLLGTVTAAYPLPTILLALAFLQEAMIAAQVAGIVLVLGCVLLLSHESHHAHTNPPRAVVMALLAFIAWGVWGYLAKVAVTGLGEGNLFGAYSVANAAVVGVYLAATRRSAGVPARRTRRVWVLGFVTMALGAAGVVALTLAYARGPASLVSAVTGSYPVISTLAAHFTLKERFGRREAIALAMFVPGIYLIAT